MPPEKETVKLEASRLDLPETASAAEIRDAVYAMKDELKQVRAERDTWKERAEENQALAMEYKRGNEDKKVLEGKLIIQAARDAEKIDKGEEEFYLELWLKDPVLCAKRLESLQERRYLRNQESLRGPVEDRAVDAEAEFHAKVAEAQANNKDLSKALASRQVYAENPGLFERVSEARRARNAAKSGVKGGAR